VERKIRERGKNRTARGENPEKSILERGGSNLEGGESNLEGGKGELRGGKAT